ncbi:MAG: pentapeptide repeat-containing protein [Henriciella sp.]|nr:pentapeptide repeat-containing protein [Henriciella sp.]
MSIAGNGKSDAAAASFDSPAERWLAQWRDLDFSWDGLARAEWSIGLDAGAELKRWRAPLDFPGNGKLVGSGDQAYIQASLQDYWRWSVGLTRLGDHTDLSAQPILMTDEQMIEAGLLVEWDGRLWHILHRPETTLTTALSEDRSGVVLLAEQLRWRFRESKQDFGGADSRVQLVGTRARKIDLLWRTGAAVNPRSEGPPIFVRCAHAEFNNCNASSVHFGSGTQFERTKFVGLSDFNTARFGNDVKFDQSIFGDQTDFYNARFRSKASFTRVVFGTEAHFRGARFGADAAFRHARFGDLADFGSASFIGACDFRGCHFGKEASFVSVDFGPQALFRRTQFGALADFSFAKLPAATVEQAKFGRKLVFQSADLGRARFRDVDFRSTKVKWSGATLDDAEFAEITYDQRRLRGNCEGLKGGGTIWGDALLRRDLQDQDYIDTLDSRMKSRKPEWVSKPKRPETIAARLKRLSQNIIQALNPNAPRRIWVIMLLSAVLAGSLTAAIVDTGVAAYVQSLLGIPTETTSSAPDRSLVSILGSVVLAILIATIGAALMNSWYGRRAVFKLWAVLGYGRDWDRVALLALILITFFGLLYNWREGVDVQFAFETDTSHWFEPWFVAAMGFATLGIADVAEPITGVGQLLMIANVLAGFTIFGLLLAVLGNRFARRS